MTQTKTKLELVWVGKDKRPRLEPRILLEDKALSHRANAPAVAAQASLLEGTEGEAANTGAAPTFDNLLIQGDNLLALKALEQQYAGKVKCIFIDPPYNTGSAFTHYDDGVEHSMWLTLMRDRLEILRSLLSEDGSIWITIDDHEAHYLKVLCDEVFGRGNFVASNIWQKRYSRENREAIGDAHDYVLLYARNFEAFKSVRNRVPITEAQAKVYKNPNNHPRGRWRAIPMTAQGFRSNQMYKITTPSGVEHRPPEGRCWSTIESEYLKMRNDGRIYFGKDDNGQPNIIRFLDEVTGFVPWTWWPHEEVGHTDEAKKEMHAIFGKDEAFATPKPERLLHRVIHIATNPGDLVLDSFAGSGTTGAVAQKMGRRWIMVELGEHCRTHIVPRLKKVIDGQDAGGITQAVNWQGGGGFRYLRLAPSLLKKDQWGNWVINPEYKPEMLAEAMCKHMGFTYAPSGEHFWRHGHSTETDFIYVTTGSLSHEQLKVLSDEVGPHRSLLICCKAFMADAKLFANLTLKKIPKSVLGKCQWDHDDYSFSIDVLAPPEPAEEAEED